MKLEIEISDKGDWRGRGNGYIAHGGTPETCLANLLELNFGSGRKETREEYCHNCKPAGSDVLCSSCDPNKKLRALQSGN